MKFFSKLFLAVSAFVFFSCSGLLENSSDDSSLTVYVPSASSGRALQDSGFYEKSDVTGYLVVLLKDGIAVSSKIFSASDGSMTFDGLDEGIFTVSVTACRGMAVVAEGSSLVNVSGSNASVSVTLHFVQHGFQVSASEFSSRFLNGVNDLVQQLTVTVGSYEDLAEVRSVVNSLDRTDNIKIILTDDININRSGFVPMCTDANRGFTGIFDGQGHRITMGTNNSWNDPESGLEIYTALFAYLGRYDNPEISFGDENTVSVVRNVIIDCDSEKITGKKYGTDSSCNEVFGAVAGIAHRCSVEKCENRVSVEMCSCHGIAGFAVECIEGQFYECLNSGNMINKWTSDSSDPNPWGGQQTIGFGQTAGVCAISKGVYFYGCISTGEISTVTAGYPHGVHGGIAGTYIVSGDSGFMCCYYKGSYIYHAYNPDAPVELDWTVNNCQGSSTLSGIAGNVGGDMVISSGFVISGDTIHVKMDN